MGEAKRRREAEKNGAGQEKRELAAPPSRKGLVISNPIEIRGTSLFAKSSNLVPQELRTALLYWDDLVWPSSRAIHFASNSDEEFLESSRVLARPSYTFNGDAAQGMAMTQLTAFQQLDDQEPGKWSLAQGQNSFLLHGGSLIKSSSVMIELVRAIPVPNKDVPLQEILEFKERRRDELMLLRVEIEGLFAEVEAAENTRETLLKNVQRIDAACSSLLRLGHEWQFPIRLTNLKSTYEFRPFATLAGVLAGYAGGQGMNLPLSGTILSTLLGAASATAPALKISFDGLQWKGLRPRRGPFHYVYQFHHEVF